MCAAPPSGIAIERFRIAEGTLLRLEGAVDERFPTDVFKDSVGVLAVDMRGITRITSFGIRAWRQALGGAIATHVYFVAVPPCGMAQFGMVSGFGGKGQILSFQAPYRCNSCGAEMLRLVDRRSEATAALQHPPAIPCACGRQMEFDDLPDLYREALSGTAPLQVFPALFSVLGAADSANRPLKIVKSVEESATLLWLSGALDGRAQMRHAADGLEGDVVLVADQVTACDAHGIERLTRLISQATAAGCRVWIARPAPALEDWMAAAPFILTNVTVIPNGREQEVAPAIARLLDHRPGVTPPPRGSSFLDRYSLIRQLGAGGMAEIFLARQHGPAGFDRRVALKRILPNLARDPSFVAMFLAEARMAARLSHQNIVQIHELIEAEGHYCIVMEYVDGRDLSGLLRAAREAGQQISVDVALRIAASVCAALDAAHTARDELGRSLAVVHRDVSPHNVLVGNDGSIKLTDFGIAHAAGQLEKTLPGVIKGKVSYLAPETLAGADADPRTDIFAAGVLLYECLAGYQPFKRQTDYQTYQAIQDHLLPPITVARPDAPPEVDEILARATAKDRERRYPGAGDMLRDVEQVIADLRRPAGAPVIAAWVASLAGFSGETERSAAATGSASLPPDAETKTLPDKPR